MPSRDAAAASRKMCSNDSPVRGSFPGAGATSGGGAFFFVRATVICSNYSPVLECGGARAGTRRGTLLLPAAGGRGGRARPDWLTRSPELPSADATPRSGPRSGLSAYERLLALGQMVRLRRAL